MAEKRARGARDASNGAIFRDARRKPRAGWCSEGRSGERERARAQERREKRERERERATQPPMCRYGVIDISNCFDGEEVHRPARPGRPRRGGMGWDATCPGSRIFEGAQVDPVPSLNRPYK